MARASRPATPSPKAPGVLPLANGVLGHHLRTLSRPMQKWWEQKRVPPVLLLTGPHGVGKRQIAHWLAQWLLCEKTGFNSPGSEGFTNNDTEDSQDSLFGGLSLEEQTPAAAQRFPAEPTETAFNSEPCGSCPRCNKALQGTWVDFAEIAPEQEGDSLKIDQFRELKATMGFGAFDGAFRITLITGADRMTPQAANSLLKLLEEPPPGWIFFMTAADSSLILPTLLSRSQTMRLKPFSADELRNMLRDTDLPIERHGICADLAQGSWGRAVELAQAETWEHRAGIFRFLERPQAEISTLVDWAAQEPAQFQFVLDHLEQVCADLIRWSLTATPVSSAEFSNRDGQRALSAHAQAVIQRLGSKQAARAFWIDRARRVFRARMESMAPLNRKVLIQDVLLPFGT